MIKHRSYCVWLFCVFLTSYHSHQLPVRSLLCSPVNSRQARAQVPCSGRTRGVPNRRSCRRSTINSCTWTFQLCPVSERAYAKEGTRRESTILTKYGKFPSAPSDIDSMRPTVSPSEEFARTACMKMILSLTTSSKEGRQKTLTDSDD